MVLVSGSDPNEGRLHRKRRRGGGTALENPVDLATGRVGDVSLGVEASFGVEDTMPWVSAKQSIRCYYPWGFRVYIARGQEKRGCNAVDLDYGCFHSWNDGE